ncbi:hypothetical protein CK203_097321 [Vitis vinifera]|uniref:Reverse transcriptase domain-containing protein n=1 Tax=Vitis vinifera TaxID=29760 RepID=A0A438D674_VITVI|nr:hypothetical protein CK203_097321 [Vitis vinifera]
MGSKISSEIGGWGRSSVSPPSPKLAEARRLAFEEFKKWDLMEESSWSQKAREIWLRGGDKNIRLFHKIAIAQSRNNLLTKVRVNGALLTKVDEIKDGVRRAFHTLLSKSRDGRPTIRGLCLKILGRDNSRSLEEPFSEEEVFDALNSLCGDKAPGLDSSKGWRQGGPLSSYLFIMTLEALSQLLSKARSDGFILCFRVERRGGEGIDVSHLLFINNTP